MGVLHVYALAGVFLCLFCYYLLKQEDELKEKRMIWYVLGAALLFRVVLSFISKGHETDMACFAAWSDRMAAVGPGGFYADDYFSDYPPGYMYLLWPVGILSKMLGLSYMGGGHLLLIRLLPMLCDLGAAYLLYGEAKRHLQEKRAVVIAALYAFLPAVIVNSTIWGQVDSVYTLLLLAMCICIMRGKMPLSYVLFGLGILIKPQMAVFTPLLLIGILDKVILHDFSMNRFLKNLGAGLASIGGMFLLAMPFGIERVIAQFVETMGSYPYASVNAYNFWAAIGKNWYSQEDTLFLISCATWGTIAIVLTCMAVVYIGYVLKDKEMKYPLIGAFIMLSVFTFSVRMHERYSYPVMVLLLLAFAVKPSKKLFGLFTVFSMLHFYNVVDALFFYDPQTYNSEALMFKVIGYGCVICVGYMVYLFRLEGRDQLTADLLNVKKTTGYAGAKKEKKDKPSFLDGLFAPKMPKKSDEVQKLLWLDAVLMAVGVAAFALVAYLNLGDMKAPESVYHMDSTETLLFHFKEGEMPTRLHYYIAPSNDRKFATLVSNENWNSWIPGEDLHVDTVFTWTTLELPTANHWDAEGNYVEGISGCNELWMSLRDGEANLIEFVFTDEQNRPILPQNASEMPALFDEQNLMPAEETYMNSMYFDEIYHARTAYEFLHDMYQYEGTHPPLGKILMGIGIVMWGMNPFGWRFMGVFFATCMLPFMYLFALRLTRDRRLATLGMLAFAFDFMHFSQARLATVDSYVTFFIIAMFYFMFRYIRMSFYDTDLKEGFKMLGLSGIAMGLGVACKWPGVYAGIGLAVLFFGTLFRRNREYAYALKNPKGITNGISHKDIIAKYPICVKKTIRFCLIFFMAIPAVIYTLSYIPFKGSEGQGLLSRMLDNQTYMLNYHAGLTDTHPFSSFWYQWPSMSRPIWYYSHQYSDTIKAGISGMGNPAVWFLTIPVLVYMLYLIIRKKDKIAMILTVSFLAQFLPWVGVTRVVFIYHFYPSVPFVVLMLMYMLYQTKNTMPAKGFSLLCVCYGVLVIGLFVLFYPVLSGQPVDAAWVEQYLRWQDGWVLI